MKKAVYYIGDKAIRGVVIEEGKNADGVTVSLAKKAGGKAFIIGAPVSKAAQPGHAVLGEIEGAEEADENSEDDAKGSEDDAKGSEDDS